MTALGGVWTMQLKINGKKEEIGDGSRVADLLRLFELAPLRVAVEVNQELVPRTEFDSTLLHDGDRVEIVTLVGGG